MRCLSAYCSKAAPAGGFFSTLLFTTFLKIKSCNNILFKQLYISLFNNLFFIFLPEIAGFGCSPLVVRRAKYLQAEKQ